MADFPIVGVGSSAGGLEALQKLFGAMPPDGGLAFIIAAHLDPTQKSHLTELLGRCTKMPVVQIENSIKVEPNHVYVIAPDQELTVRDGIVRTNRPSAPRGHRHPVDSFFRSLAEDQGERAIAIVLSGTGTNGSLGLRFIKAEGGIAMAQDPESAGFAGMPQSAIATGIVDLVLPPDKMPEALLGLARHPYVRQPAAAIEEPTADEQLHRLLTLVRSKTRQDFSSYKRRTLLRRIHRRMGLHRIEALPNYIERLRNDPDEIRALAADLTINVTGFFRDPEAWRELEEKVVAPLVQDRSRDSTIRVWVPGCSTGEEAYSIAMLILEHAEAAKKNFELRLFATDVAEAVLGSARAGAYPASIEQDVAPERLERWFEREDDTYCVRKAVREAITFAPQNLLQDPPFSRIDLISCRNLLIYIEADVQKRLLGLFHFALREGGHLFLGSAETVSGQEDLFKIVSKKSRIYRRLGPTRHDVVDFPLVGAHEPDPRADTEAVAPPEPRPGPLMDQLLLDRYAPASALIDARCRVHFLRGPTGDYLQPPSGEPSYNLLAMAREGLQTPLRMAVRRALNEGREVTIQARVRRSDALHPVRVRVEPLKARPNAATRLLVSFFERETAEEAPPSKVEETSSDVQLHAELETTREDLRLSIEQMESANEELKASNEEIRSINEELQASNEELETSKEELQSLNEELNTVNNQLQAKVRELEERTADLNNLLNSTDIATLFLDRKLCIRWFTPAMQGLLELMSTDIGRPISHFAPKFSGGDLLAGAKTVLAKLAPAEAEVVSGEGRWYIRRMVPYRTQDDRIDGVVVTFTDITTRKQAEEALRKSEERLRRLLEIDVLGVLFFDQSGTLVDANDVFLRMTGYSRREVASRKLTWRSMTPPEWIEASLEQMSKLEATGRMGPYEKEYLRKDGSRSWMWFTGARLGDDTVVEYCVDISDRKRAENALLERDERVRALVAGSMLMVWETGAGGVVEADSPGWRAMTGQTLEEWSGYGWLDAVHPEDRADAERRWREAVANRALMDAEFRLRTTKGDWRWTNLRAVPLQLGADGSVRKWLGMHIDISERKQAEEDRELLTRELSHRVKNTLAVVQSLAKQTNGRTRSIEAYREAFVGRLQALARAHNLLLDAQWRSADLKTLLEQAVEAYRVDHPEVVQIEGDPVVIRPRQGLGLSMVLHELGTNAAKYGALSRHDGRLRVSWQLETEDQGRRVRLHWQERHGPVVEPPTEKGFGTQLIERACTYDLDGEVELNFAPEGLTCEIVFPLE